MKCDSNDLRRIRDYKEKMLKEGSFFKKIKKNGKISLNYQFLGSENSEKEKNGILLESIKAIHPLTGIELPIYLCNYILKDVGTGAIMGVPAHDERDREFAEKCKISILQVINEKNGNFRFFFKIYKIKIKGEDEDAHLINSEVFSGKKIKEAIPLIKFELTAKKSGKESKVLHIKVIFQNFYYLLTVNQ